MLSFVLSLYKIKSQCIATSTLDGKLQDKTCIGYLIHHRQATFVDRDIPQTGTSCNIQKLLLQKEGSWDKQQHAFLDPYTFTC